MTETNPYAPPKTADPEASSLRYWRCYGERVMARNGATLPEVDLETGASGVPMTAVSRTYQSSGAGQGMRVIALVVVYLVARNTLQTDTDWLLWVVIGGSILLNWLTRIRGVGAGLITVWEYRETPRQQGRALRQKLRAAMLFLSLFLIIAGPWLIAPAYPADIYLLASGVGLLLVRSIWALLDRTKTRSESTPQQDWLRIRNVHPDAMVKLRAIEAAEIENAKAEGNMPRMRKVFTNFYHRYPLRSLLGYGRKSPFTVLLIFLMKLFRSKRLERESFEFTEAEPVAADQLHKGLREKCESWLAAHPDWSFLSAERLAMPAGDLLLESAALASPGLEHLAVFHYSWLIRGTAPDTGESSFLTWLEDGTLLYTTHMFLLPLDRPAVETARVQGSDEEIFHAHLARCASRNVSPAGDPAQLLRRLHDERLALNQSLEAAGLRGPTREAY